MRSDIYRSTNKIRNDWNTYVYNCYWHQEKPIQIKFNGDYIECDGKVTVNVPFKRKNSKTKYRILVKFMLEFFVKPQTTNLSIQKYTTKVQFYNKTGNQDIPVFGVHYDGDYNIQKNHPIFHAQIDNTILIDCLNNPQELNSTEIKNIRIPTPQMDIFNFTYALHQNYTHLSYNEILDQYLYEFRDCGCKLNDFNKPCYALYWYK